MAADTSTDLAFYAKILRSAQDMNRAGRDEISPELAAERDANLIIAEVYGKPRRKSKLTVHA